MRLLRAAMTCSVVGTLLGSEHVFAARFTCPKTIAVDVAAGIPFIFTSSQFFQEIPDNGLIFTQGGSSSGCVVIHYSADVFSSDTPDNAMIVRPLLDGATLAAPAQVVFTADDDEDLDGLFFRSQAFQFIFPTVAPGRHRVVMQWRSVGGTVINMHSRTMTVTHQ
jgi:hypothetical protein